jgi:hypothetical protein
LCVIIAICLPKKISDSKTLGQMLDWNATRSD